MEFAQAELRDELGTYDLDESVWTPQMTTDTIQVTFPDADLQRRYERRTMTEKERRIIRPSASC